MLEDSIRRPGPKGFSLNGPHRLAPGNRDMKFSQQGTRFRGIYPYGSGGHYGQYYQAEPLMNAGVAKVEVDGNQWEFVKPSVLSMRGMLRKRFRWVYNGQYPNNWVQPVYTGNQTDTASQGLYVQNKAAANDCVYGVNDTATYVNYFKQGSSTGCQMTPARGYKMVVQQGIAPYTKQLHQPKDASSYTLKVQQKCQTPNGLQKPFPYAVQTGTSVLRGGINVSNVASSCNTGPTALTPPDWYVKTPIPNHQVTKEDSTIQAQTFIDVVLNGTTTG